MRAAGRDPGDLPGAEGVDEQPVVLLGAPRVGVGEVDEVVEQFLAAAADHRGDGLLGLERHQRVLAVGVADAVHLRRGPAQLAQHRGHLLGLGEVVPLEVDLVGRQLRDDEADAADLGPAEELRGVGLQRAPAHRRPVALVREGPVQLRVAHDAAGRGDVALLDRQDDVVLQRLVVPLEQHVVGRQPGAADAEPAGADDVLDVEGDVAPAGRGHEGVPVLRQRLEHAAALVVVQPAVAAGVGEAPLVALDDGHPVEQAEPAAGGGGQDRVAHRPLGVVAGEREGAVVVGAGERLDLVEVGAQVGAQQVADDVVTQRLAPRQQREAGGEPAQVPADVPHVGLVEVVDVEDDPALRVHVGAEVLGVQVALDPDPRGALVAPGVVQLRHVGVEEAGAAPVEREGVGRHLAELRAEGVRVGGHEVGEGLDQGVDDQLGAFTGGSAGRDPEGGIWHGGTVGGG